MNKTDTDGSQKLVSSSGPFNHRSAPTKPKSRLFLITVLLHYIVAECHFRFVSDRTCQSEVLVSSVHWVAVLPQKLATVSHNLIKEEGDLCQIRLGGGSRIVRDHFVIFEPDTVVFSCRGKQKWKSLNGGKCNRCVFARQRCTSRHLLFLMSIRLTTSMVWIPIHLHQVCLDQVANAGRVHDLVGPAHAKKHQFAKRKIVLVMMATQTSAIRGMNFGAQLGHQEQVRFPR